MTPEEMKQRTKYFALRIIRLAEALPKTNEGSVISKQILKSGTSVGANYRAACRSRTDRDFMARMGTVEEEADETIYWLELIVESGMIKSELVHEIMQEAEEILRMIVASINTVKKRLRKPNNKIRNLNSEIRN